MLETTTLLVVASPARPGEIVSRAGSSLALAAQTYARLARDMTLIDHATDIRLRVEIRAGEMLREMAERGERHKGDNKQNLRGSRAATPIVPKLSDLGVSKAQSSRWQKATCTFGGMRGMVDARVGSLERI